MKDKIRSFKIQIFSILISYDLCFYMIIDDCICLIFLEREIYFYACSINWYSKIQVTTEERSVVWNFIFCCLDDYFMNTNGIIFTGIGLLRCWFESYYIGCSFDWMFVLGFRFIDWQDWKPFDSNKDSKNQAIKMVLLKVLVHWLVVYQ